MSHSLSQWEREGGQKQKGNWENILGGVKLRGVLLDRGGGVGMKTLTLWGQSIQAKKGGGELFGLGQVSET